MTDKTYKYEELLESLLGKIRSGEIPVGERLPTEREMVKTYQVSRGSLREALRILEESGYIDSTPGGGRRVLRTGGDSEVYESVKDSIRNSELEAFLEAREFLDDIVVRLACERATEEDIRLINETAARLNRYYDGKRDQNEVQTIKASQLHMAIAKAAHNSVLEAIYRMGYEYTPSLRKSTLQSAKDAKDMRKEHMDIVKAVLEKDSLAARYAAHIHNRNLRERYRINAKKEE